MKDEIVFRDVIPLEVEVITKLFLSYGGRVKFILMLFFWIAQLFVCLFFYILKFVTEKFIYHRAIIYRKRVVSGFRSQSSRTHGRTFTQLNKRKALHLDSGIARTSYACYKPYEESKSERGN